MIKTYRTIRRIANLIDKSANRTVEDLIEGRVQQEPSFTERMIIRISDAVNGYIHNNIRWQAVTLTDRGPNAQEKRYGADFVGVLQINLPEFNTSKGFLAQAKLLKKYEFMKKSEIKKMLDQCNKMLHISPDSYVFFYSTNGIYIVPAISVISSTDFSPSSLYSYSVARFFETHFKSFIGDRNISTPEITVVQQLEELLKRYEARAVLGLSARFEPRVGSRESVKSL
jgi:hypothetical protein